MVNEKIDLHGISIKSMKNWNVEIEKKITERWKNQELYSFNKKAKKIYSIDTPPPYVNSPIHIAQAVTYCYMDFFARFKRMKGFEVLFPLGLDRNGLPIEMAAEKKFKVSPFDVGREKFVEYCRKIIEEGSEGTKESFAKLGISFTSYQQGEHVGAIYLTDSPEYRAITQATFINLYKKGLIYEDTRINNWDSELQTTIADSEIVYQNLDSTFSDIEWKVKETGEKIIIATTRPELICTCGMVIFNPKDKRYKHLEGKTAITPIFNREVPIQSHSLAQIDKGTGIVMMCSAGDLSDIQFFREMKITPVIAIEKDGTMNHHAGFLKGLKVKDARKKIIEELRKKNLLLRQEKISHRTPISERSNAEVEFIEMPEFYLKQMQFKKDLVRISNNISFFPPESKKILLDWIDCISIDWPISRRRFYATEIPLWHNDKEELIAVPLPGGYYRPWKEKVPENADVFKKGKLVGKIKDFKNRTWRGEERVFDTWMDSSISELYILKYLRDDDFFKKAYPASLRPQGKEIVRTWFYYTLLRGYLETKKACFEDAWIHQHLVDEKGNKMAKSRGNAIDPREILKEFGAEAIRLWAAIEGDLSKQDLKVSKDKIGSELKTLNKILNISKFVMQFEKIKTKPILTSLDKLFIDYLEDMTEETEKSYNSYDFHNPSLKLRKFVWDIFAANYIELVKARAYNSEEKFSKEESDSAKYTLNFLLDRFLLLLYPITPQITSLISQERGIDLLKAEYPSSKKGKSDLSILQKIIDFNGEVWRQKKIKGISLRGEIEGISIPKELKPFEKDLKIAHSLVF